MPEMTGTEAVRELRKTNLATNLFSDNAQDAMFNTALIWVKGYLLKESTRGHAVIRASPPERISSARRWPRFSSIAAAATLLSLPLNLPSTILRQPNAAFSK